MGGSNIFLGLNAENISALAGETFASGARASRSSGYAGRNIDHEVQPEENPWKKQIKKTYKYAYLCD